MVRADGSKSYNDTRVSVERTQNQIGKLLERHGALGYQFTSDFTAGQFQLRFQLETEVDSERLKVMVQLSVPRGEDSQEERANMRALFTFLKSQLEAIEFGIVKAADVFLPFIEVRLPSGATGTVKDAIKPAMKNITDGQLLGLPEGLS
jgi:hypothetical protein